MKRLSAPLLASATALLILAGGMHAYGDPINLVTDSQFIPSAGFTPSFTYYQSGADTPLSAPTWVFTNLVGGGIGTGIANNGSAFGFSTAPSGASQVGFVQAVADDGTISQSIGGLIVGDKYILEYSLEGRPSTGASQTIVSIGSDVLLDTTPTAGMWTFYQEYFIATSATEDLSFEGIGTGSDASFAIDNPEIFLTPEPRSLLLLGTGLLSLCALIRRKAAARL